MKPQEILGMVEEAAGTKMYEDKKISALATLKKKDAKVEEMNQVLRDQINPTLEKLEAQQAQYVSWLKNKTEFEQLEKFRIAYTYTENAQMLKGSETELKEYEKKIKSLEKDIDKYQAELKDIKEQIGQLRGKKEKEISSEVHELQQLCDEASKELTKFQANYKNLETSFQQEQKKLMDLQQTEVKTMEMIEKTKKELESHQEKVKAVENQVHDKKEQLQNLQRQYQAISVGVAAGGEGSGKTLADQLMDAKKEETHCDTEAKSCQARLNHAKKELGTHENDLKKSNTEYNNLKNEEKKLDSELNRLKKELSEISYSEEGFENAQEAKRKIMVLIRQNEEKVSTLKLRLQHVEFRFNDPYADFPRHQVHGRVAKLLTLKNGDYATALDVAGGPRLRNVIIENEKLGQAILDSGLKERTTFLPLNKINPKVIDGKKIQTAYKTVGQEAVTPALQLIDFNAADKPAMEFVFGSTLVCHDSNDARKVTFNPAIQAKTVTTDGDLFDPQGTLTGGSKPAGAATLHQLHEVHTAEAELKKLKDELQRVNNEINKMVENQNRYQMVKQSYDLKLREIDLLKQRIERTPYFQLMEKVSSLGKQIEDETTNMEDFKKRKAIASEKITDLEEEIQNFNKKDQLNKTQKSINQAKKDLEVLNENIKKIQSDKVRLESEQEQLQEEVTTTKELIGIQESEIAKYTETLEKRKKKVAKQEKIFNRIKSALDAKNNDFMAADSAIGEKQTTMDHHTKAIADAQINIKKFLHKIQSFHDSKAKAAKNVAQLKKEHKWISFEEQYFGKENSAYDFERTPFPEVMEKN